MKKQFGRTNHKPYKELGLTNAPFEHRWCTEINGSVIRPGDRIRFKNLDLGSSHRLWGYWMIMDLHPTPTGDVWIQLARSRGPGQYTRYHIREVLKSELLKGSPKIEVKYLDSGYTPVSGAGWTYRSYDPSRRTSRNYGTYMYSPVCWSPADGMLPPLWHGPLDEWGRKLGPACRPGRYLEDG
jgi:hypothetical protein